MGKPRAHWPRFDAAPRAVVTVLDVAEAGVDAGSSRGHAGAVVEWAASVWSSWNVAHGAVEELTGRLFTGDEPFWGSTDRYAP